MFKEQCAACSLQYAMRRVACAVCSVQFVVSNEKCAHCIVKFAEGSLQRAVVQYLDLR